MQTKISNKQNKAGIAALLTGGTLCGCLGLFTTHLLSEGADPMMSAFLRMFSGAVFVLPIVLLTAGPKALRISRKEFGAVLLIGVVGLALDNFCYMTAMQELGIASAAVLMYTAPGFLVLLSAIFFKDKLTGRKLLAVVLNFGGCAIMVTGGDFSTLSFSLYGLLIGLLAGFSFALNNVFTRAFAKEMDPFVITFYGFLLGAAALAPLAAPWNRFGFAASPANLLAVAGMGLIPTAGGFGLYYKGVLMIRDKAVAPVVSSIENIVACVLGFLVLSEFFNLWKAVGIVLVFVSILMSSLADAQADK